MGEWPLLIFTITIQASVGGILMLWVFQQRNKKMEDIELFKLFKIPLIVIAVLSLVGLGASFVHLGSPMNAFYTISNLATSWMSREILMTGMFIGLAVMTAALAIYQKKVTPWLLIVTAAIGLIDVFCMAALYANTLVGPWNSVHTFTSFYGSTFILGAILAVSLLIPTLYKQSMKEEAKRFLKISLAITLFGVALQVIGIALIPATSVELQMIGGATSTAVLSSYKTLIASRWIISVLGIVLFGYLTLSSYRRSLANLTFLTLLVFFLSEGMSRYIFYLLG